MVGAENDIWSVREQHGGETKVEMKVWFLKEQMGRLEMVVDG